MLAAQRLQALHDDLGVEDDLILAQPLQGFFVWKHHGGHCLVSYTLQGQEEEQGGQEGDSFSFTY